MKYGDGVKIWILVIACLGACDDVTPQEYVDLVEGARECTADGDCILAGAGECTCAAPIHVDREQEVLAAGMDLDCERVTATMCPAHANLRCEANRCVTDDSP